MSKKAFDSIAAGLADALADAEGKPGHVTRVHAPISPVNVKEVRGRIGLTQKEFSATFSIPLPTLVKWEQGQSGPTGATRLLLHVINKHPKAVMRVAKTVRHA
jgi:putative transcriptional regulator